MRENFVYKPSIAVNMLDNKHKLVNTLNSVALILIISLGAVGCILNFVFRVSGNYAGGLYFIYSIAGAALCLIYIYLHELAHAFAILLVKGQRPEIKFGKLVASCGSPKITFGKAQYFFVASFPFVFFCAVLVPPCVLLPSWFFPLPFVPLCYNVFGSMGDMYMIGRMMRAPRNCIIIDRGTEVSAFVPFDE